MSKNHKKEPWLCNKCGNFLTGDTDNTKVEFRAINKQITNVEYLKITATCKKCGLKQSKEGTLSQRIKRNENALIEAKVNMDLLLFNLEPLKHSFVEQILDGTFFKE